MSTEVTLSDLGIADIVDFMGIDSAPSERVSLARLKMSQTAIEKEIVIDGDALRKPVIKAGSYKLTIDKNTPDVFSETVTFRPFAFRWQYTVWDNDKRVSQKTVLSTKLGQDLKDTTGGFNLGRPSGYIEDMSALPKSVRDKISSVRRVYVNYGLATLDNPTDAEGNALSKEEYTDIPVVFDMTNSRSIKEIKTAATSLASRNIPPICNTFYFSHKKEKLGDSGESYFRPVVAIGERVDLSEKDKPTAELFKDIIEGTNRWVMSEYEKNNPSSSEDFMSDRDKELVNSIVEVEELE